MATRTVVCPDCDEPLPYGRLSCAKCGALLASVAGAARRAPLRTVVLEEPARLSDDGAIWTVEEGSLTGDQLAGPPPEADAASAVDAAPPAAVEPQVIDDAEPAPPSAPEAAFDVQPLSEPAREALWSAAADVPAEPGDPPDAEVDAPAAEPPQPASSDAPPAEPVADPEASPVVEPVAEPPSTTDAEPPAPADEPDGAAPADIDDAAEPPPPEVEPAQVFAGRWPPAPEIDHVEASGPQLRPSFSGRSSLDLGAPPPAQAAAVDAAPAAGASEPAGAWVPPAVEPDPDANVTRPDPATAGASASRLPAPEGSLRADAAFADRNDIVGWLVAAGSALATLGFLLPWSRVIPFVGGLGYTDRWGLAVPSHAVVLVAAAVLLGFAMVPNRLPAWIRNGVLPLGLGALLVGLVWPYVAGGLGFDIGSLATAIAGVVLVLGGVLGSRGARHPAASRSA